MYHKNKQEYIFLYFYAKLNLLRYATSVKTILIKTFLYNLSFQLGKLEYQFILSWIMEFLYNFHFEGGQGDLIL